MLKDNSMIYIMSELDNVVKTYGKVMVLHMFVDEEHEELIAKYKEQIAKHNDNLFNNPNPDAGFDILTPESSILDATKVNKVDYHIVCRAEIIEGGRIAYPTGFYMYPRSSISKSDLRLANNVGIIDSGYRGNLIGMFDVITNYRKSCYMSALYPGGYVNIEQFDRHLQICAPSLMPMYIILASTKEELGETVRGENGIGSTGK
jgi:dUTP pyrophosphatase